MEGAKQFLTAKLMNRRLLILGIIILLIVIFISGGFAIGWKTAIGTILFGFLVSALATLFSIGIGADLLQKRLEAASRKTIYGSFVDFWMMGKKSHFKIFIEVYYKDGRRSVNFDTMNALSELSSALTQIHGDAYQCEVIDANTLASYSELENLDSNVILLGGDRSIPLTTEILCRHKSRYKQECDRSPRQLIRLAEEESNRVCYESIVSTNQMIQKFIKEYALVTRIPVNRGKCCWYLVSGNHGVGTYLASLAISERKKCPFMPPITDEPMQIMLIGENIIRSCLPNHDIDITSQRGWEFFPKENMW